MLLARTSFTTPSLQLPSIGDKTEVKVEKATKKNKYGSKSKKASAASEENAASETTKTELHEKSSIQDIVHVMLEGKNLKKPTALYFYASTGKGKKSCANFFIALANLGKCHNSFALHNVFDSFKIDVKDAKHFKVVNNGKVPLMVVVDKDKKVLSQTGGNGAKITTDKAFLTLCKAAKKFGVDLKKAVKTQDKLIVKIFSLDIKVKNIQAQLALARKSKSKAKIAKCEKELAKLKAELNKYLEEEKELWAKINAKILA